MTTRAVPISEDTRNDLAAALKRKSLGWQLGSEHFRAIREVVRAYDEAEEESK